jgi:hypothetical protein
MGCSSLLGILELGLIRQIRKLFLFPLKAFWKSLTLERTFFQTPNSWPMNDRADPLDGWAIGDVNNASSGASLDLYGKLFIYLRDEFSKFLNRFTIVKMDFQLYCIDVKELAQHLDQKTYDRIEVRPFCKYATCSSNTLGLKHHRRRS